MCAQLRAGTAWGALRERRNARRDAVSDGNGCVVERAGGLAYEREDGVV